MSKQRDSNLAPDIILNGTGYWNTNAGWVDGEAVDGGTDWWVGPLIDDPQLIAALDRILELENEEMQLREELTDAYQLYYETL